MKYLIIIVVALLALAVFLWYHHQKRLKQRAWLMGEAIRNRDYSFRLNTEGLPFGERAMQETLNQLGMTIRRLVNQNEVESWERLTRVLTHEMMNATAPITSISQSLLARSDVQGTPLQDGIQAIYDTSRHLSEFVSNYRKMSELEQPTIVQVDIFDMFDTLRKTYPMLTWNLSLPAHTQVHADSGMLRQVLINLVKNAVEAGAQRIIVEPLEASSQYDAAATDPHPLLSLYIGNDGAPIPPENRQSRFVPFFTTKQGGSGIGLSLSRRMMVQQGGMLELCDKPRHGCHAAFVLSVERM